MVPRLEWLPKAILGFVLLVFLVLFVLAPPESWIGFVEVVIALGMVVAWQGAGSALRRRPVPAGARSDKPLDPEELQGVRRWARRDWLAFVGAFAVLGLGLLAWGAIGAPLGLWAYYLSKVLAVGGVLAVHFGHRCPRCGQNLGFESNLGLPSACGRCGVRFKPRLWKLPELPHES